MSGVNVAAGKNRGWRGQQRVKFFARMEKEKQLSLLKIEAMLSSSGTIQMQLEGQSFSLPKELSAIVQEIENSKTILSFEAGWDAENALPVDKEIWLQASGFLLRYALRVFNLFSLALDAPDINPCPNGSIDLSWRTKSARMLVNIRKENSEMLAFFYGDLYGNKMPIKGNVPAGTVEDHLACWMKNLV